MAADSTSVNPRWASTAVMMARASCAGSLKMRQSKVWSNKLSIGRSWAA